MLPSMPILFTRESQDAFGNKIQFIFNAPPSTVTSTPKLFQHVPEKVVKPEIKPEPPAVPKPIVKTPEVPVQINEKEAREMTFVSAYFAKVQSRLNTVTYSKVNKFIKFKEILNTFDCKKESPVDIYRKVERLFGPENADLAEEFLLFLTPGQATQVGRFMDHLMLTKMHSFIELLQATFARKPALLRKVLKAISNSLNSGNFEQMRSRVLPHLRSSPRLTRLYRSLFPDERPPDSVYDSNTINFNESSWQEDNGSDLWEFEDPVETKRKPEVKDGVDITYLQGRVFLQQGRVLRPAHITFPNSKEPMSFHIRRLAPAHYHFSPPDSDEERSSPRRATPHSSTASTSKNLTKRPKRNDPKSTCVRNLMKDVNKNNNNPEANKTPALQTNSRLADCSKGVADSNNHKSIKTNRTNNNNTSKQNFVDKLSQKGHNTNSIKVKGSPKRDNVKTSQGISKAKSNKRVRFEAKDAVEKDGKPNSKSKPGLAKRLKASDKRGDTNKINSVVGKKVTNKSKQTKAVEAIDTKLKDKRSPLEVVISEWTRDEDKTILQVLKSETDSSETLNRIQALLPQRSIIEIRNRFFHVMNLLQEMALGGVT